VKNFKRCFEEFAVANYPAPGQSSADEAPSYLDHSGQKQMATTLISSANPPTLPAAPETASGTRSLLDSLAFPIQTPAYDPADINLSLRVLVSCRQFTFMAKQGDDDRYLPLDPLAKEFQENPLCADGLVIVSQPTGTRTGETHLWQLHGYSAQDKTYRLTEIDAAQPISVRFALADVAACCTLSSEFAQPFLRRPNDSFKSCPLRTRVLTIRTKMSDTAQERKFRFVHVPTGETIHSISVQLPGRTTAHTSSSDDGKGGIHSTTKLSDAALSFMDLTRDQLTDKKGEHVLHDLRTRLSRVESTVMGSSESLARISLKTTLETASNLLAFRIRDISDFERTTPAGADMALQTKKAGPRTIHRLATDSLKAYDNFCIVLYRAFDIRPDCILVEGLRSLGSTMQQFLNARVETEPDLATNGFCGHYLNLAVQALARVMSQPTTTNHDIRDVLKTLPVTDQSAYYAQTHAFLLARDRIEVNQMKADLAALQARTQGPSTPSGSTRPPRSSKSSSSPGQGAPASKTLCFHSCTTQGCQTGDKCTRAHTTPTPAQVTLLKAWLPSVNGRFPDKTPLELKPSIASL
jgi:hypothetical protein